MSGSFDSGRRIRAQGVAARTRQGLMTDRAAGCRGAVRTGMRG
ncbi:hypothetical protein [Acetobacter fallax]|nr:hypothetical protein [Acetobacter fallax]